MTALLRAVAALALLPALAGAAPAIDGRWEGTLRAAGDAALPVIVDVPTAPGRAPGAFVTLPGRSVQRARIASMVQRGDAWHGTAAPPPGADESNALRLELRPARNALAGTLTLGGHAAPLALVRTGPAVLTERTLAALPRSAWGQWKGRYDIGFGPRELTLRMSGDGATATVVGRRTTELRFDNAGREGAFLRLRADAADFMLEAAWATAIDGVLNATVRQGPFETAMVLQRERTP